jgi:hypothetical protein
MNHLETIVLETIGVLLAPYTLYDPRVYLCPYHDEDKVRSTIHAMLRMESCRTNQTGILSPCFPSKGFHLCRNTPCPYVIGHSIYLWVGFKREALHRGEAGGHECTFKHTKEEVLQIRNRVFELLDIKFRMHNLIDSPPLRAMERIHLFHRDIVQLLIARGEAKMEMTPTFNVSTAKPMNALLFKSDDSIFVDVEPPPIPEAEAEEEEEEEESTEIIKDDELFPPIAILHTIEENTLLNKKTPSSRKDLPYQMDGI